MQSSIDKIFKPVSASYDSRRMMWNNRLFQVTLLLYFVSTSAFYIPGIYPTDYPQGAELDIRANKLTSSRSNVPYDFYFLPFCSPAEEKEKKLNIGQVRELHIPIGIGG